MTVHSLQRVDAAGDCLSPGTTSTCVAEATAVAFGRAMRAAQTVTEIRNRQNATMSALSPKPFNPAIELTVRDGDQVRSEMRTAPVPIRCVPVLRHR